LDIFTKIILEHQEKVRDKLLELCLLCENIFYFYLKFLCLS